MSKEIRIALIGAAAIATLPGTAIAQDAAESAAILSGTSQTGGAQRSMGSNIAGSINRASNAIAATTNARAPRRSNGSVRVGHTLPAGVDPLEGTDAATYTLGNGSSIRTTGRFNTDPGARCVENCEGEKQP